MAAQSLVDEDLGTFKVHRKDVLARLVQVLHRAGIVGQVEA